MDGGGGGRAAHAAHAAAHELAALETFVRAAVARLPALSINTDDEDDAAPLDAALPARSAAFHAACADMLRAALGCLAPLAPRLAKVVAQVWELASLNVFAALRLAAAALRENAALRGECAFLAGFQREAEAQAVAAAARRDRELQQLRAELATVRSELHRTRQRAARLGVEKTQLRRVLGSLLDLDESSEHDGAADAAVDAAAVGAAEEQELYGARWEGEDLEQAAAARHPLESAAGDLAQVLAALEAGEARHVAALNALDRFVNSRAVALLWRYGSEAEAQQLLARSLRSVHAATQTAAVDERASAAGGVEGHGDGEQGELLLAASGATGRAQVVAQVRVLPAGLRAVLGSRPRVLRVLERRDAARLVLALMLEKLEADAAARRRAAPRPPLFAFLHSAFMDRYGVASLADYHLLELVKSALLYAQPPAPQSSHQSSQLQQSPQQQSSQRQQHQPSQQQQSSLQQQETARIAVFARLCELVPLLDRPAAADADAEPLVAGNLHATALAATLDLLGDLVELDAGVASLDDVEKRFGGGKHDDTTADDAVETWTCPLARATLVVTQHLAHVGRAARSEAVTQLQRLADDRDLIAVDALLSRFCELWVELDARLATALRAGFRRQLMLRSPLAVRQAGDDRDAEYSADDAAVPPLEALMAVVGGLVDDLVVLAPSDVEALRSALWAVVDAKQPQLEMQEAVDGEAAAGDARGRLKRGKAMDARERSSRQLARPDVCIGGVGEKEFVFHALQVLRERRVGHGTRTNGRRLEPPPPLVRDDDEGEGSDDDEAEERERRRRAELGGGDWLWVRSDADRMLRVPPERLKPGLARWRPV